MGLDNYFGYAKGANKKVPEMKEEVELCWGMLSGNGSGGSFRGKVYSDTIMEITGETLYQKEIPNSIVRQMADDLKAALSEPDGNYRISKPEIESLYKVFKFYGEAGCSLYGWW